MKSIHTVAALMLAHAVLGLTSAHAQSYPERPIRIVVPYGSGGTGDVLARTIAARLQTIWGQGVVVENKPGASGNIGTDVVVKSPADGYTLVVQNNSMVVAEAVGVKSTFDMKKDLTPIMLLAQTPSALVANPKYGIKSLKDLVEYDKAHPNTLSYGSCGVGTPHHMIMELLKIRTKTEDISHASYRGCAPAVVDALGGQIALAIVSANLVTQHVKAGKLDTVGISAATRYDQLPNTPTFNEQGQKGLDFTNWFALMGPANMPKPIVEKIRIEIDKILAEKTVAANLADAGVEIYKGNGDDLAKILDSERPRYAEIARIAKIKAE